MNRSEGHKDMNEETRKQLLVLEDRNARIFQVMGSLKLLNIKVKSFVRKLEKVENQDAKKQKELNGSFRELRKDVQFFEEEHKHLLSLQLYLPSVDTFALNAKRLFPQDTSYVFSILEMKRISVYLYRMADKMLKELAACKLENENEIHELHAKNGKYYFNRK